jgi:hypothetical protein
MRTLLRAAALAGGLLLAGVTAAGPASASPGTATYTAQTRYAGLTSTQAATLQDRVDRYLATDGGVQTAANEIRRPDGSDLLLALPGQASAQDLLNPAAAPGSCPHYYFCAYSSTSFHGDIIKMYSCIPYSMPFSGTGSWSNNQSSGTKARMANRSATTIYVTPGAYSQDTSGDWTPVWYVQPC